MTANSPRKGGQKEYLNELMKKAKKGSSDEPFPIGQMIGSSLIKIQQELQLGKLTILQSTNSNKKESYQQKMQILNKEMNRNDLLFKKAKQQLLIQKKKDQENKKSQMEEKSKESKEMVKRWTQVQQELQQRKRAIEQLKSKIVIQEEEKRKKQQEDQTSFQKLEKRKKIQQKMKQIEQEKQLRQERNIQAQQKIQQLYNPKFIEIEQKFRQFEEEIKFQEKILRQNHKIAFKLDHQAIKAHEKAYLTKVEQRKDANSRSPKSADGKQKPFNILLGRDEQKTQEQKQKRKRRKQFQEKLKQIPVPIDESKKVKVQIAIDKGKNRIKYNFLGQKALNDFQIYGQFRDFELNVNARDIGKEYLRQLPQITKNSRITKSHSLNSLKECQQRPKYKDYLKDLKSKRSEVVLTQKEQLDNLMKNQGDKGKALEKMTEKSKFYELQAKRRLSEAGRSNGLQGSIRKSKQADEIYLKSIRAKLACLELQS